MPKMFAGHNVIMQYNEMTNNAQMAMNLLMESHVNNT